MKRPYTDAEIKRIETMRKAGLTFEEMGKELGRKPRALYSKFYSLKRKAKRKTPKAPVVRRIDNGVEVRADAPSRPMIALVGTPLEVTKTIRELFS